MSTPSLFDLCRFSYDRNIVGLFVHTLCIVCAYTYASGSAIGTLVYYVIPFSVSIHLNISSCKCTSAIANDQYIGRSVVFF